MKAKIFISCGQASQEEKEIANEVKSRLGNDHDVYLAIEAQSIQDVNSEIISNLRLADYYIFIDFRRERLGRFSKDFRGSLFTNQELALAYFCGFEHAIFLQQSGVKLEGMNKYILSNARQFKRLDEVPDLIQEEIHRRGWSHAYSRHLIAESLQSTASPILYKDHAGTPRKQFIYHIEIKNRRTDLAAISTIASLKCIETPAKTTVSPDTSYLKWAHHHQAYQVTILPTSSARFDAFAIEDTPSYDMVYLHSLLDLYPRRPIINIGRGQYKLTFQIYASGFPLLEIYILLDLTGNRATSKASLM